ncbi:MAG: DNA polymerase IV [Veillonella sp. oral taxon 158]|uniref:DNA polymerase IV n=1 Tax=Veillonella sp. oral taxon 158 TaxID=671228 RepID=UPI0023522757|nr:DNA polymerase IV [Veillonella sp. oral taxon 158]MBS6449495.1 DNA polymerase IV [Veillonella sp. oral taxon 158]
MRRWIMHVDMDAFFASIEQLDHPEYKGHPVIVGGLSSRGVVATCSYEARKFGVHSAMPISRAKKLCPDGIYVYPRMDRYKEVSEQIFSIMKEFTPYIEPLSVDEAFLEVSGMSTMYSGPKALGRAIKDRVFEETGLIISAGLAPNKFLAKLASDLDKPDGLVVIPYGREKEILAPLPIKRIWGVGPRTEKILKTGGFHLMRHIQALPDESSLIPLVGNQARRIWELANGIDDRPVETDRKIQSIGAEETYEEDLTDGSAIELEFRYFANRLSKRLRKRNLLGHTVSIKVRYDDFTTVSRQKRLDTPSDHEHVFFETALLLWNKLMQDKTSKQPKGTKKDVEILGATTKVKSRNSKYSSSKGITFMEPPGPIRLLGLTVSGLDEEVPMQDSLFESPQDETEDKLASVLDSLESKFGETVIMSGALWQRFHGDNGTRRKRSELKSAVDARGDAPSNTVDDIPSNTADDTSANVDAETTEKKEPKKF